MTSQFDPQAFLDMTLTEPTEKRPPLPMDEYMGVIGEVKARTWQSKDGLKGGIAWDVPITIQVPAELQVSLKMQPTVTLTDGFILDLTEAGMIDNSPGKNRKMRAYRDALDLNKPGDKFSARLMTGRPVKVRVVHEIWEGQPVERIQGIVKA